MGNELGIFLRLATASHCLFNLDFLFKWCFDPPSIFAFTSGMSEGEKGKCGFCFVNFRVRVLFGVVDLYAH